MRTDLDIEYTAPRDWRPRVRPRKRNISVPMEVDDIELLDKISQALRIDRAVIMRMAIQFSIKNKVFLETIEQF
jgi:hypothetical protein